MPLEERYAPDSRVWSATQRDNCVREIAVSILEDAGAAAASFSSLGCLDEDKILANKPRPQKYMPSKAHSLEMVRASLVSVERALRRLARERAPAAAAVAAVEGISAVAMTVELVLAERDDKTESHSRAERRRMERERVPRRVALNLEV